MLVKFPWLQLELWIIISTAPVCPLVNLSLSLIKHFALMSGFFNGEKILRIRKIGFLVLYN